MPYIHSQKVEHKKNGKNEHDIIYLQNYTWKQEYSSYHKDDINLWQ